MKYNSFTADYFQINFNLSNVENFQNKTNQNKKKKIFPEETNHASNMYSSYFISRIVTIKTTFKVYVFTNLLPFAKKHQKFSLKEYPNLQKSINKRLQ